MSWFVISIGILIGLYIFVCLLVYFYQEKLIFFPQKLEKNHIFSFQHFFKEVFLVENSSEDILHALWFQVSPKKTAQNVVLYFHGNAGSLNDWGHIADDFLSLGYDILILDYRQYGKSRGSLTQNRMLYDAQTAFDFIKQYYQANNITIYGRSIGTGIAAHLASHNFAKNLILETPYDSFKSLVKKYIWFLPVDILLRFTFNTALYLKKVKYPIYIFHGTLDEVIPYHFGEILSKKFLSNNPTHFITIPMGSHNNLSNFPIYQKKLKEILTENIS